MQREEERSTVPCLMPFLSVVLPVRLSRWVKHPFRRGIHPGHGRGRGARERLVLLYHVRLNRNYIIATCRLVCVDMAQGGKQPVAVKVDLFASRCITAVRCQSPSDGLLGNNPLSFYAHFASNCW